MKKKYVLVGTGGRCSMYLDAIAKDFTDVAEICALCDTNQTRMNFRRDQLKEKFGNRVFATPKKMGAETAEANINAGLAAAQQICDFFATGCTKFQLNK